MRVLGIDPGSHRTGWGVVSVTGSKLVHLGSDTILAGDGPIAARLCVIASGLETALAKYAPEAVAVESVFHAKNARSALILGHARGVALLCAARTGVPLYEYTAGQIKQATVGFGRADKEQVQEMVRRLLGLDASKMSLDTSDALAAAICHAQSETSPTVKRLAALMADSKRARPTPLEPLRRSTRRVASEPREES